MAPLRLTPIFRPITTTSTTISSSPRSFLLPTYAQQRRLYTGGSSYGGGEGDPKGENPSDQGSNPSADLEHPGPPPPSVGQGTGGGPTKKGAGGHNTQRNEGDGSGQASTSGSGAAGGDNPQPKIHKHDAPEEHTHSEEVRAHNEDMAKRHDRPSEKSGGDDRVDKNFWKGWWFSVATSFSCPFSADYSQVKVVPTAIREGDCWSSNVYGYSGNG